MLHRPVDRFLSFSSAPSTPQGDLVAGYGRFAPRGSPSGRGNLWKKRKGYSSGGSSGK